MEAYRRVHDWSLGIRRHGLVHPGVPKGQAHAGILSALLEALSRSSLGSDVVWLDHEVGRHMVAPDMLQTAPRQQKAHRDSRLSLDGGGAL